MIAKIEISTQTNELNIIGISVRTTNQNGQSKKDIGELWARFIQNRLIEKIDNRASDDIYCVYTGYESDHTGFYTAILGCEVNCLQHVAWGLTDISIPAGKYQVNTLAGKFPDNIGEAWEQIWNSGTDRKYTADFDIYRANAKSLEETKVEIYLAVN